MEYVYFVLTVAAVGLALFLFWHVKVRGGTLWWGDSASKRNVELESKPIPPLMKTVRGPRNEELDQDQFEFQDRLNVWQRGHGFTRSSFNHSANHG